MTRVKLWLHVNLGNMRSQDLFVTDRDYKIIPVESTKIEVIDELLDQHTVDETEIVKDDSGESTKALFNF